MEVIMFKVVKAGLVLFLLYVIGWTLIKGALYFFEPFIKTIGFTAF